MDSNVEDRRQETGKIEGRCSDIEIHGCMEEMHSQSVWVVTNWDGEVLCRCSDENVARRIARALNSHSEGG